MIKQFGIFVVIFFAMAGCAPDDPRLPAIVATQEGNAHLKSEQYNLALNKYLEAMAYNPFRGEVHLDAGLSFQGLQEAEKALQAFTEAEKLAVQSQDQTLTFMARFNKGFLLGAAKRIDEALDAYQSALEIYPNSVEVKTNIELLTIAKDGGGGGENENKDQNKDSKGENQKDQKDQKGDEKKDDKKDGEGDKDKEKDEPKDKPQSSPKYKPRPFDGKDLSEGDVKKILGELKRQEEKIRAEYNKKERKERPRDKDW